MKMSNGLDWSDFFVAYLMIVIPLALWFIVKDWRRNK